MNELVYLKNDEAVTGHVWRGKEALRKKNKAEEHIEE